MSTVPDEVTVNQHHRRASGSPEPASSDGDNRILEHRLTRVIIDNWGAIASIVGGILLWEIAARVYPESVLIVSIADIARAGHALIEDGVLTRHVTSSGKSFGLGYVGATVAGIAIGVSLGLSRVMRTAFEPWIYAFYSVPIVALAPIFIIAFGIGLAGHTAVVLTLAFFPIAVNTIAGIENAEETYVEVARAFRANSWQIVRYVLLPSAVPLVITGMRLAVTRGLTGVVVAELFGARAGVGYMILLAQQRFDTKTMYVGIVLLGFAGIVGTASLRALERRLAAWRPQ